MLINYLFYICSPIGVKRLYLFFKKTVKNGMKIKRKGYILEINPDPNHFCKREITVQNQQCGSASQN